MTLMSGGASIHQPSVKTDLRKGRDSEATARKTSQIETFLTSRSDFRK